MSSIRHGKPTGAEEPIEREVLPEETSVYADMKAILGHEVEDKFVDLPVPSRTYKDSGLIIRYNATFDYDTLNKWMKSATRNKKLDPKNLALIVLHNTCDVFIIEKKDGNTIRKTEFLVEGRKQNFDSEAVQSMVGTMGGWAGAIMSTYANDGHMLTTMNRIITEAGYAEMDLEDVEGYDPLGS